MTSMGVKSRDLSSKTICQEPLPFIFPINRLAITMTYFLQQQRISQSALSQKALIGTLSTFAYRVPYSLVAAPDIKGRKNEAAFPCPSLNLIDEAVNAMNALDQQRISAAENTLSKYLPKSTSEGCWQTVLKFVFLLELCKAVKTDEPLFKKEFALPKGHYKSIQDYVLKDENISGDIRFPGLMRDIGSAVKLSDKTIENIWRLASCMSYRIEVRPIVDQFFSAMKTQPFDRTWDHDVFELIFSEAITDAEGNVIKLPKTTSDWSECLTRLVKILSLNPNLLYKKLKGKLTPASLPEDDDSKAKNTPLGCMRGDRLCQDPVLRFLNDILTIFQWVRRNYNFCLRDSAIYTLYLLPHLAFWKLNFDCTNIKQNMSFPFFKGSDLDPNFFLKNTKLCSFLIHAARKLGTENYLHWAFSGFAGNYLDDAELQKQALMKAQGHLNESKECAYSTYQGVCGRHLINQILNTAYRCL